MSLGPFPLYVFLKTPSLFLGKDENGDYTSQGKNPGYSRRVRNQLRKQWDLHGRKSESLLEIFNPMGPG